MLYLISKLDYYGIARPVAVAKSLPEADALVESLTDALPKGEIAFYCREAMVEPKPFLVKDIAASMSFCE